MSRREPLNWRWVLRLFAGDSAPRHERLQNLRLGSGRQLGKQGQRVSGCLRAERICHCEGGRIFARRMGEHYRIERGNPVFDLGSRSVADLERGLVDVLDEMDMH